MALKIYTKTGDKGTTSLIGGTKVSKANIRIDAYGTVDELNSWVGYVNDLLTIEKVNATLREIQDRLFTIGAALACDPDKEPILKTPDLKTEDILFLEKEIDRMYEHLPVMKSFILPGGHPAVSSAHIARCVCRRAERIIVDMQDNKMPVEPLIVQYLNRLSDYLFALSRFISHTLKLDEIPWRPRV